MLVEGASLRKIWLLALLLLSGCAVRLAYGWLDWVVEWRLDDYFDLSSAQQQVLEKELDPLLDWHRHQELPQYAALLRQLSADLAQPLTAEQIDHYLAQTEMATLRLAERIQQPANRVASTLSDRQIREFMQTRRDKQAQRRRDWQEQGTAKVHRDAVRKVRKDINRWLGGMEPEQATLVDEWARWQERYYPLWLDYQDHWLDSLEQTFALKGSDQFGPALVDVVINSSRVGGGRYSRQVADSRQQWINWMVRFTASLTPAQRRHIRDELDELAGDLTYLADD